MSENNERQGRWAATFTGKRVYFMDPHPDDFCIEDIAHGLANTSRYSGQAVSLYTVAEHSVRGTMRILRNPFPDIIFVPGDAPIRAAYALEFLLHDAHEAYMGDPIGPLKLYLPDYRAIAVDVQGAIAKKFGVPRYMTGVCDLVDRTMLVTEGPVMFPNAPESEQWWRHEPWDRYTPFTDEFRNPNPHGDHGRRFWPPEYAERVFIATFRELCHILGRTN